MGRKRRDGTPAARPRKNRSRPTPKWLLKSADLDAIAKARCLMVLSVLSGEKPVSDAILEAKVSRGTYYQLETRALNAMLSALSPLASPDATPDLSMPVRRIAELEAKVSKLEQEKRRAERLLFMTRKVIRPVSVTTSRGRGRPRKSDSRSSMTSGKSPSPRSKTKVPSSAIPSTPTTGGAGVP